MQQVTIKPKQIPTQLNFAYHQQKQINRLKQQNKIQQFFINCLIIAQLFTISYDIYNDIQKNRAIQYPPLELLEVIE